MKCQQSHLKKEFIKFMRTLLLPILLLILSCAGPNPNPGERTADMDLIYGDKKRFVSISEAEAKLGKPWALLRAGIAYGYGYGTEVNLKKAEYYLTETTKFYKTNPSNWENGILVGTIGKSGFFNSNTDALLAYYHLANIFYEKDKAKALKNINFVIEHSKSQDLFFCCEFYNGIYITQNAIIELKTKIEQYKK